MSSLRRDLFQRRLWPIVVLLVAAIVGAPFVIHSRAKASAEIVPPAPTPTPASADPGAASGPTAAQPASATSAGAAGRRVPVGVIRRPLRARVSRDPFAPGAQSLTRKPSHTAGSTVSSTPATSGVTVTPAPATDSAATTSEGSESAPVAAAASATTTETTTMTVTTTATATTPTTTTSEPAGAGPWTIYEGDARLGTPGDLADRPHLVRLTPLPSAASLKAMFTGVSDHGQQAVFALADGVTATGPGLCRPDHVHCSAIVLEAGQAEELTYVGPAGNVRTLQLAVSRITGRAMSSRSAALAAYQRSSQAGRCELDMADPVQYDQARGAVSAISHSDCRHTPNAVPFPGASDSRSRGASSHPTQSASPVP